MSKLKHTKCLKISSKEFVEYCEKMKVTQSISIENILSGYSKRRGIRIKEIQTGKRRITT